MRNRFLDQPWKAPLVPIAVAVTAGTVADRLFAVPVVLGFVIVTVSLFGWWTALSHGASRSSLIWLWIAVFGLGTINHQRVQQSAPSSGIYRIASDSPQLVRLRGIVADEPVIHEGSAQLDPLRSYPADGRSDVTLLVSKINHRSGWSEVSGRVRLFVPEVLEGVHAGDELQVIGYLSLPSPPRNPGEFDFRTMCSDRGIAAVLNVSEKEGAVKLIHRNQRWSLLAPIRQLRIWAGDRIEQYLPPDRQDLARALLLGQQEALDQEDWDRFQRTGVVHVLAISGQHLMVLAVFLALLFRLLPLSRRQVAVLIPVLLLIYAVLTGWRPPVRRAFFMVTTYCGAAWFRRMALPANSIALAWLIICVFNPTAIFYTGCQLSFLAVMVLIWGTTLFQTEPRDPLEEQSKVYQPLWWKVLKDLGAKLLLLYLASWIVWIALAPMIAARFHLVCPTGLLIGVPVLLLTSVALLCGFLMFAASLISPTLAAPFAWLTDNSLSACDYLVRTAEQFPGAYWYVPDVPSWWVAVFYAALLAGLLLPMLRRNRHWVAIALVGWVCLGLSLAYFRPGADQLRCTFLAVGHGSCIVMETPDGRTLLYDAGAITGPQVTRRQIAPFLWRRGIRRIDEVFLSHADLDHFNGLPALFDRFAVGQISCTPSFSKRDIEAVKITLQAMKQHAVPIRTIQAGDILNTGSIKMKVLHPPSNGPAGPENVRSLVLLIHHENRSILLTGDLESTGLASLLQPPPLSVDILMAPHHGSHSANTEELAEWARPKVVISTQGKPRSYAKWENPYTEMGAKYLTTWKQGAVTVISEKQRLIVESYLDKQRWILGASE